MKMHLQPKADNLIRAVSDSVADRSVTIGETVYRAPVIITPTCIISDWTPGGEGEEPVSIAGLQAVADLAAVGDIVLLGVGQQSQPPRPQWHALFINQKAILESMSLRAACHTYNIMLGDGRAVIAALVL